MGQKHWSGKPDGAAGGADVSKRWSVNVCLRRLEASAPKPRRLAQIKKLRRKPYTDGDKEVYDPEKVVLLHFRMNPKPTS